MFKRASQSDPPAPSSADAASILRRARRLRFRVRPETASALAGAYHSARPGIGLTFSELRAYEPGDDVRHLDWNVTARQGRPYVRRFVEERALTLWLVVDVSASMRFGPETRTKADRAAQTAALLAAAAIQSGDRAGLLLISDCVEFELPPRGGFRQLSRILRALIATPTASGRTQLGAIVPTLRRSARRALYVLHSDFQELEPVPPWRAAASRHDMVALRFVDPMEEQIPNVGLLTIEDAESRRRFTIDTAAAQFQEAYARESDRRTEAFARWCAATGIESATISTTEEPIGPLMRFLQARHRSRGAMERR